MTSEPRSPLVRDIGEQGLLARVRRFCPAAVVGDDAAVLALPSDRSLVVTTDMLVDGVHFSDRTTSPADTGWRAAAANLSDLAAMGATPVALTVALGLPGDTPVDWVEDLYRGMVACLQPYHTEIVGGDICRSPVRTVAITAFGQVDPQRAIRRDAAQPGYAIVVTGVHGASRAGWELLLHPELGRSLSDRDRQTLIAAHQRPQPRLDVLPILWEIVAPEIPIAGMDSSDGLADAVLQICRASGVGAKLDSARLPMPSMLTQMASPERSIEWVLYGGEDFELVLCLPEELAVQLVQRLGNSAAIVGTITPEPDVILTNTHPTNPDRMLSLDGGFQHFAD
ncbi:MAG TPA: thiamine-phosphate kinase [Oscillatoriales cyanobacterium M59_W2019_021]|nr:MAG: thiamine-phosphate kinase [Cyanobacteria bacterium J055]HIK34039.1 thiamine-phosphate kinase [Oscillatoriales cyanobacterium M4454_W2019_049]HIK53162.1 thiamine-phosphate kinase [Oscillatoriales cyanobacterium M59_W2019_021]